MQTLLAVLGAAIFVFLCAVAAHAGCPLEGDPGLPRLEWGARCGPETGACDAPLECLWPPDCRCDMRPTGMPKDPKADGWQKVREKQG